MRFRGISNKKHRGLDLLNDDVPSSVTWIRQSRYFTSYHSSKQGSDQRSSKRENIIRSSSVQYLMLKRGIVAYLLSHSMVLYYCICSNR